MKFSGTCDNCGHVNRSNLPMPRGARPVVLDTLNVTCRECDSPVTLTLEA